MGIDYCNCISCGRAFPDAIDYVSCNCGNEWCDEECANEDGYKVGTMIDEDGDEVEDCENTSCAYCRNEKFDDAELFEYSLKLLNISKETLIEKYKEGNNEQD